MLTREQLQENLDDLKKQYSDLEKDTYAVVGAIQNTNYLIDLCDDEEENPRTPE